MLTGPHLKHSNGQKSREYSATLTISSAGENTLAMSGNVMASSLSGEGPYTYDENSGGAEFVDSIGTHDTLVFTAESGEIVMNLTMYINLGDGDEQTITLSGTREK